MSLLLEGTFQDVGLVDLLRLIGREERSGRLEVTIDGRRWYFGLLAGRVVFVDSEEEGPTPPALRECVVRLSRFRRGAFRLDPDASIPPCDPDAAETAEVLADAGDAALLALHLRFDEIGGEQACPRRDCFPTPDQMKELSAEGRTVYGLVNGERSVAEIVLRSRLDPARVLDELESLGSSRMVAIGPADAPEAEETAAPAPGRRPAAGRPRRSGSWRDLAFAAAALLLLAAAAVSSHRSPAPTGPSAFAIRREPLAEARQVFETRRVQAALEAYRFAVGRWPAELEDLVTRGYLDADALTGAHGRPYYYARRGDDVVLLAPER